MIKRGLAGVIVMLAVAMSSRTVSAEVACPTTQDANNAILKIYAFTPAANHTYEYYIGMSDFYGTQVVAACVRDQTLLTQTLYLIVDAQNALLGHLPVVQNHLCYADNASIIETSYVLEADTNVCNVTLHPLNYHGYGLFQYGRAGSEHLHGGSGIDTLYGGLGNDSLADYDNDSAAISTGDIYGESGDDRLWGSAGGWTRLTGGPGVDSLVDYGSGRDFLSGGDGNDCCLYAAGLPNPFTVVDCGNETADITRTLSGTVNCDIASTNCGPLPYSCPWF